MQKLTWTIIACLLLFLTLSGAASADLIVNKYTNDFAVESPYANQVKLCACENRADMVSVINTGNFLSSYHVSILADEQDWYEPSITDFELAPGERQDVLVYARPGCGTTGIYTYTIKIASSYDRERLITRTLDVKQCQNVFLTVDGGTNESNLCQPLTYELELKNVAEFADTFTLDFGSFNDYADLEKRDYYLVPDQSEHLNVTITPPCGLFGQVEIPFTISSKKNKVTEQKTATVFIENQFDHEIELETQAEFCSRVPEEYTFTVRNLVDIPNEFDVSVNGPSFISQDKTHLKLKGMEAENVTLALTPKKGQEGTYNLKVKVKSDLGDIQKTRDIHFDVFDCFAYELGYVDLPRAEDGAFTDQACCGEKTYELNIRNSGQTEETYNIDVQGPSWFAPEERTIRLKPSENRNVKFTAQLPCTDDTYEIPVTVWLTRYPAITETAVFRVESETQRTCHAVEAMIDTVSIDEEDGVVPVIVRNTGIAGGTYSVGLDAGLYNGTHEEKLSLSPGEEAVLHLATKTNLSDYFDGKYVGTITFTHDALNISYNKPFWTRFQHVSPLVQAWRVVIHYDYGGLGPCFWSAAILAVLVVLSVIWLLVLLASATQYRFLTEGWLNALRTLAVIAILIIGVAFLTTPLPAKSQLFEEPLEDNSGLVLQWYENERFTINLNDYFTDPDSDWLEYTATQPANVAIVIDGSEATFIPDHNWAGEDRVVFTASDQKGGLEDSPVLALKVLQRKELSFVQWVNRYCFHLTLGLVLLILIALLLISLLCLAPKRKVPYGQVIEPPKRPKGGAVHTRVTRQGEIRRVDQVKPGATFTAVDQDGTAMTLGVAEKLVWPKAKTTTIKKKTRTVKKKQKSAKKSAKTGKKVTPAAKRTARASLSRALDRALVSQEPHELRQVLKTHGKKGNARNIAILRDALKQFKASRGFKPKNRKNFYRFLKKRNWLRRLHNR